MNASLGQVKKPLPLVVLLSAPSEAGKRAQRIRICRERDWNIVHLPSSVTTRERRPDEVDGVDCHFWTHEVFQTGIREGKLLGYEKIPGGEDYCGTLLEPIERAMESGRDILCEVDVKGGNSIMHRIKWRHLPLRYVSIFLHPLETSEVDQVIVPAMTYDHLIPRGNEYEVFAQIAAVLDPLLGVTSDIGAH